MIRLQKYQSELRIAQAIDVEIKASGSGIIEGYASTFGGDPDRAGDVVRNGAFTRTLKEHQAEGTMPAMLWQHRMEDPVGSWHEMHQDAHGLFVKGQINLKTTRGREAFEHVQAGDVSSLSIGYVTPEGGRKYVAGGVFELGDVDLFEISLVAVPANHRARLTGIKQLNSKSEAVAFLRDAGLSKLAASRFAAGGFPALAKSIDTDAAGKLAEQIERATLRIRSGT